MEAQWEPISTYLCGNLPLLLKDQCHFWPLSKAHGVPALGMRGHSLAFREQVMNFKDLTNLREGGG